MPSLNALPQAFVILAALSLFFTLTALSYWLICTCVSYRNRKRRNRAAEAPEAAARRANNIPALTVVVEAPSPSPSLEAVVTIPAVARTRKEEDARKAELRVIRERFERLRQRWDVERSVHGDWFVRADPQERRQRIAMVGVVVQTMDVPRSWGMGRHVSASAEESTTGPLPAETLNVPLNSMETPARYSPPSNPSLSLLVLHPQHESSTYDPSINTVSLASSNTSHTRHTPTIPISLRLNQPWINHNQTSGFHQNPSQDPFPSHPTNPNVTPFPLPTAPRALKTFSPSNPVGFPSINPTPFVYSFKSPFPPSSMGLSHGNSPSKIPDLPRTPPTLSPPLPRTAHEPFTTAQLVHIHARHRRRHRIKSLDPVSPRPFYAAGFERSEVIKRAGCEGSASSCGSLGMGDCCGCYLCEDGEVEGELEPDIEEVASPVAPAIGTGWDHWGGVTRVPVDANGIYDALAVGSESWLREIPVYGKLLGELGLAPDGVASEYELPVEALLEVVSTPEGQGREGEFIFSEGRAVEEWRQRVGEELEEVDLTEEEEGRLGGDRDGWLD